MNMVHRTILVVTSLLSFAVHAVEIGEGLKEIGRLPPASNALVSPSSVWYKPKCGIEDSSPSLAAAKELLRGIVGNAVKAKPFAFAMPVSGTLSADALVNARAYLTDEAHPSEFYESVPFKSDEPNAARRRFSVARFTRYSCAVRFYWFSDGVATDEPAFERITMHLPGKLKRLVWVDMISGRIFEIPKSKIRYENNKTWLDGVPMWDSPILIADVSAVPFAYDWMKMSGYELVDSMYRYRQYDHWMKGLPPDGKEPWMAMKAKDFLPCFDRYGQFKYREWPGKTHSDADLKRDAEAEERDLAAHPGPKDWDEYGGWASGPQLKATGRFRTEKVDGKWWLVDPAGHLFWSWGVMRVSACSAMTPMHGDVCKPHSGYTMPDRDCFFSELPPPPDSSDATPFSKFWTTHDEVLYSFFTARGETRIYDFSSANLYRKYGEDYYAKFADICHRRLRSWGVNTLSSSSDTAICLMNRTPFVERLERQSRPIEASYGEWWKFRDPWDPTFKTSVIDLLKERAKQAKSPWCIGYSVDNEVNWGSRKSTLAEWTLQSPADQPAKKALVDFLRERYADIGKLNAAWNAKYADWSDVLESIILPGAKALPDLEAFTEVICENYFRRTREAIKEYDPDILYLGCRFCCFARPWCVDAAYRYCDIVTYNAYSRDLASRWKLPEGYDKPVLITEFHYGANDRGNFGTGVCKARDQNERAEKMKKYVRDALSMPQLVGCHWHQFSDQAASGRFDGEMITVGWTDLCDRPYPETVKALRELSETLYTR